jgi:hypothetical protein
MEAYANGKDLTEELQKLLKAQELKKSYTFTPSELLAARERPNPAGAMESSLAAVHVRRFLREHREGRGH